MTYESLAARYLGPGEALGEALFGLIMVLTFTVGARLVAPQGGLDAHDLVVASLGCNLAWGVIDATLFLLGGLFQRSARARFFRRLRSVSNEAEAIAAIREEFGLEDEPLAIPPEDGARLHQSILALGFHGKPVLVQLRREDFASALVVFLLVSIAALPAVIPLLLMRDSYLALRVANGVLILLLFIVGCWWGRYADARPWTIGAMVTLLGLSLVFVAVLLGG